jgi:hypothetical protein
MIGDAVIGSDGEVLMLYRSSLSLERPSMGQIVEAVMKDRATSGKKRPREKTQEAT